MCSVWDTKLAQVNKDMHIRCNEQNARVPGILVACTRQDLLQYYLVDLLIILRRTQAYICPCWHMQFKAQKDGLCFMPHRPRL
eukprot:1159066-Pelagomonas_calceolata.AAC.12